MQTTVPSQRSSSMLLPSAAMFSASARAPRVLKHAFAARSPLHARAYPFGGRKLVHPVAAYSQATSVDTSDEVAPSKPSWMQHLGKGAAMLGVAALLVRVCIWVHSGKAPHIRAHHTALPNTRLWALLGQQMQHVQVGAWVVHALAPGA